jgi:hypothetical protein
MLIVETPIFTRQLQAVMLFVYPKNVQGDLTKRQIRALRAIIEEEYP